MSVDLPAPFAPTRPTTPLGMVDREVGERRDGAEGPSKALGLYRGHGTTVAGFKVSTPSGRSTDLSGGQRQGSPRESGRRESNPLASLEN